MLTGSLAGNEFSTVVGRALLALLIAWPLGYLVGLVVEHQFRGSATSAPEDALKASVDGIEVENDADLVVDEGPIESDGLGSEGSAVHQETGVATGPS